MWHIQNFNTSLNFAHQFNNAGVDGEDMREATLTRDPYSDKVS